MRFLVYGTGAVGGVVGARLAQAGHQVSLKARGAHAAAIREHGLRIDSPGETSTLPLRVLEHVSRDDVEDETVVLLAVKSEDSAYALEGLAGAGFDGPIVCLQNGVQNERSALRIFPRVYAVVVMLPATHLEPGIVAVHSAPVSGMLDIGRYPGSVDDECRAIAAAFESATFLSVPRADIMAWKHRKLIMNLGNAVQALCGDADEPSDEHREIMRIVRTEADACLQAAGIAVVSLEQDRERRADHLQFAPVEGQPRTGGSSYQSLKRGTGHIETDYLNGEISLLGRLHGVPTPANMLLQRLAGESARERRQPGWIGEADLLARMRAEGLASESA